MYTQNHQFNTAEGHATSPNGTPTPTQTVGSTDRHSSTVDAVGQARIAQERLAQFDKEIAETVSVEKRVILQKQKAQFEKTLAYQLQVWNAQK